VFSEKNCQISHLAFFQNRKGQIGLFQKFEPGNPVTSPCVPNISKLMLYNIDVQLIKALDIEKVLGFD